MPQRVVIIVVVMVSLAAGAGWYFLSGPKAKPVASTPAGPRSDTATRLATPPKTAATPRPATSTSPATAAPTAPPVETTPTTGTLIIESDVPDTSVFIDRVYLGTAPITVPNLTPGAHRLNMSPTGYEGVSETIDVAVGTRTISMKFKEITLDEKIAALHKHGIGSCAGTLRAAPQGLTFDTENRNDAFAVPLTNLETFEVDYIQRVLKVKVRGGKSYNFTDPDGTADRLYQFHQTVEKVRQRLLAGRRP